MNQADTHKKFIFNSQIDSEWLHSLYEHDFAYIMEVFGSSLDTLREELPKFTAAFDSGDLDLLRKAAHKLKPVFGFTGLLRIQESMAGFENICSNASGPENITLQYMEILELIREGKFIIQEDHQRLRNFL